MKAFGEDIKKIYLNNRLIFVFIAINIIAAIALAVFGFIRLNPSISVVKVGYSDISGYKDGVWTDMLAFPLMALILGILHSIVAVKIYHKRGAGMTKFF
ncbi:hypothetical protein IKZ77_00505, partial [Candidatus Saccharibacteria bacterium]|nr:hypothetical protein [Candidatus Saccharibacteria bacterium]